MKKIIYEICGILGVFFSAFLLGKKSGKTSLNNEINKKTLKDVKKTQEIKKNINNLSLASKLDRLQK